MVPNISPITKAYATSETLVINKASGAKLKCIIANSSDVVIIDVVGVYLVNNPLKNIPRKINSSTMGPIITIESMLIIKSFEDVILELFIPIQHKNKK